MAGSGWNSGWKARAPEGKRRAAFPAHSHRGGGGGGGSARANSRHAPDLELRHRAQLGLMSAARLHTRSLSSLSVPAPAVRRHRRGRKKLPRGARALQGGVAEESPARGAPGPAHAPQRRPAPISASAHARGPAPPFFRPRPSLPSAPPLSYTP